MPNPGAFKGARKEFLIGEKDAYKASVEGGYTTEALALICRRFFKRFPVSLTDVAEEYEPTKEELNAVDDNQPEPEIHEPDRTQMSEESYVAEMDRLENRARIIEFKKGQIKRWMTYQYMKDNNVSLKETGNHYLHDALMAKLIGKDIHQPRKKSTVNIWRKNRNSEINEQVRQRYSAVKNSELAAVRDKVAREMFASLTDDQRNQWELFAKAENERALERWKEEVDKGPSTDPVDQQRCIQGLVRFVQPILEIICKATGWKATLIAGGPEPAQNGQLNVISIHSGTTPGDVKLTFGQAERALIKKQLVPMFGSFLTKCYTPEECRSRAIYTDTGLQPVSEEDFDTGLVSIFKVGSTISNGVTTDVDNVDKTPHPIAPQINVDPSSIPPPQPSATPPEPSSTPPEPSDETEASVPDVVVIPLPSEPIGSPIEHSRATLSPVQPFNSDDEENPFQVEYNFSVPSSPVADYCNLSPPHSPPHSRQASPTTAIAPISEAAAIAMANSGHVGLHNAGIHQVNNNAALSALDGARQTHALTNVLPNDGPIATSLRRSSRLAKASDVPAQKEKTKRASKKRKSTVLSETTSATVNHQPPKRARKMNKIGMGV